VTTKRRFPLARWAASAMLAATVLALAPPADLASAQSPARPVRAVMIVLDVDGSLAGWAFRHERRAAIDYLNALPNDVRAGLITFNGRAFPVQPLTADRSKLTAVLRNINMIGGYSTGLYKAIPLAHLALRRLGNGAVTRILVLSDAEFPNNAHPLPITSKLKVDVAIFRHDIDDQATLLAALAGSSGGRSVNANEGRSFYLYRVTALASAFPALNPGPSVTPTPARSTPAAVVGPSRAPGPDSQWQGGMTLVTALGVIFLSIMLISWLVISRVSQLVHDRRLSGLFAHYGPRRALRPAREDRPAVRAAVDLTSKVLRSSNSGLGGRLEMAGVAKQPGEWALIAGCAGLAFALIVLALTGNVLVAVPLGALAGLAGNRAALRIIAGRRRTAFSDQLPELLQLLSGSLRSGFSFPQALDGVVRENVQPAAAEFGRALAESRIGLGIDVALEAIANRMDSDDLRWTVMAVRIHRQVGGNLAEVLESTAHTMRERAAMRGHVRALSAEGRLSAYILVGLPIVIGGWLFATDRAYVRPLYTSPIGITMVAVAFGMILVGTVWMRNVIKVEV
jgi:Flp pilus assembly protein TadB